MSRFVKNSRLYLYRLIKMFSKMSIEHDLRKGGEAHEEGETMAGVDSGSSIAGL